MNISENLKFAIGNGDIEAFKELLKTAGENVAQQVDSESGNSVLIEAIESRKPAFLKLVLEGLSLLVPKWLSKPNAEGLVPLLESVADDQLAI